MNISSITSLFKKKTKKLVVPDTILIKKLKSLSSQSNLYVYKDIKIYHHTHAFTIPLVVIDALRGIYLFESKEWTYDELKNADIQKAENQDASENTLAFENTQNLIRTKFNEIRHNDGVPIFNYLMMEYLSADEYEHLSDSFKELLPKEKIIFSDSDEADIFKKIQEASEENHSLLPINDILGTIFIQYAILKDASSTIHANEEQINFIDKDIHQLHEMKGAFSSGKSNVVLLKAIVEQLNDKNKKIIIIKPTILATDILKKRLLEIIEHAIVEVDLSAIEILTPLELLNRHQAKLKREKLQNISIDKKLMKKSFKVADIIFCDDAQLYPEEFLDYLSHIQKNSYLVKIEASLDEENLNLHTNYKDKNKNILFYRTNPHAKSMQLISSLLAQNAENILVVSNSMSMEKLKDDLSFYIEEVAQTLDSSLRLINQKFTNLLLCKYKDLNELKVDHIILMDLCFSSENEIEYALNLSTKSTYVLYEEDCIEINNLRNKYEKDSKE